MFHKKFVWGVIVVLLCVNAILIMGKAIGNQDGYQMKEVAEVYSDLQSESEPMQWIQERWSFFLEHLGGSPDTVQEYPYKMYTLSYEQEQLLMLHIYQQISQTSDYDTYRNAVLEQSNRIATASIFSSKTSFSYRNMVKTKEVYEELGEVKPKIDISDGVRMVTNWRATDLFLLLSVILFLLQLFLEERENGKLSLIKPTKCGYGAFILAKIAVMFSAVFLFSIIFYGENLVLAKELIGFGDLRRCIQSLDGYVASPFPLSVGGYILLFLIVKAVAALVIGSIVGCLCILTRSRFYSALFMAGISGAEILLWMYIDSNSWLRPLAKFNLAAMMDTAAYFAGYENLNILGFPVNTVWAGLVMGGATFSVCTFFIVWQYCREKITGMRKATSTYLNLHKNKIYSGIHTSMWRHEIYKLWILHKGALLLVLLCVIQFFCYYDMKYYTTAEEYAYHNYSAILTGTLSEQKERFIQDERNMFEELEQQRADLLLSYQDGKIDEKEWLRREEKLRINSDRKNALERVSEQYHQLQIYQDKGEPVVYVNQIGWERIFGQSGKIEDIRNYIKMILLLVLVLSPVFSYEKRTGMHVLIQTSGEGTSALSGKKTVVSGMYAVMMGAIAFFPYMISVWRHFEMRIPSGSVHSILCLSSVPGAVPLAIWVVLYIFARLMAAFCSGMLILFVCKL